MLSAVNGPTVASFQLLELQQLSLDAAVTGTISTDDPPTYVGADYDSDYLFHTKFYAFTTAPGDDLIVELSWIAAGNAALVMYTQGGAIKSTTVGEMQVIQLPPNTTGNLLVGQSWEAGRLTQPVQFTLQMKRRE